jgi:hypothetical protein
MLASRRAANEGSAESSLRTINSAEVTYQATAGGGSFGTMANLQSVLLLDAVLGPAIDASHAKSGYYFTLATTVGPPAQYWCYALPSVTGGVGKTGTRRFGISEDGVLRDDSTLSAPANEAAVQAMTVVGN